MDHARNIKPLDPLFDESDDLLWKHLKTLPAFRGVLRAVEARFYQQIDIPEPVLDLGCGDGHFAEMTFDQPLAVGVDPWLGPLTKSYRAGSYGLAVQSLGDAMPFADGYFGSVISNSVLEHIDQVEEVLKEAARVLQPGGKLLITMPSHQFTNWLGGAQLLERIGLQGLADRYRTFFNTISRHAHTDSADVWSERLAAAGFGVERWQYYFSPKALHALEIGHAQGLPSAILHFLLGYWVVAPWRSSLRRTEAWLRPFFEEGPAQEGAYLFVVAHKVSNGPVKSQLPKARPFTLSELQAKDPTAAARTAAAASRAMAAKARPTAAEEPAELSGERDEGPFLRESPKPTPGRQLPLIPIGLLLGALLSAMIGQSIVSAPQESLASGLRWYGYALICGLLFFWQQGVFKLPRPGLPRLSRPAPIARRRHLIWGALLLAALAARAGSASSPATAILLWLTGIGIALAALGKQDQQPLPRLPAGAAVTAGLLFCLALVVRLYQLSSHPFILNGIEASIGLDALSISRGSLSNPFATGWLTNPTLPTFLMSLPIKLLGPSTLSVRLLSPFVGAATVAALYVVGRLLWNERVGLVSAILLAGSHFHLNYSRLGMSNIWDPFLALLALGLLSKAWQRSGRPGNRAVWLMAGLAIGLNAYTFTSGRLLPLMLLCMLATALLFDRERLRREWRHIAAAAAVALVTAAPQMIYYAGHQDIFWERARAVGILEGQTNWVNQWTAESGLSRGEALAEQLRQALASFNSANDHSPGYKPGVPLLGTVPAILYLFGLLLSLLSFEQMRCRMLFFWVAISLIFGAALLLDPPNSHRLLIAVPALALLAALALVDFSERIVKLLSGTSSTASIPQFSRFLMPALLTGAILMAMSDTFFYFGRYQNQHTFGDRNTEIADGVANYLNSLDGEWTAYFHGPPAMYISFPTITFLSDGFEADVNLFDVDTDGILQPAGSSDIVHIFLPERASEVGAIQQAFPGGSTTQFHGYFTDPLFVAYQIDR